MPNIDQMEFEIFPCGDFNFPFIRLLNSDEAAAPIGYIIGHGNKTK